MRGFCGSSIFALVAGAAFEEIASKVNAANASWVASVPAKFASVEAVRPYLGAWRPGHPKYTARSVRDVVVNGRAIPESFDARTQWPDCGVIGQIQDQSACGSCWAFASVASFEARACIATGKNVRYSAEDTAFCSFQGDGCDGGESAWYFFETNGVVTGGKYEDIGKGDTCLPYSFAPCAHHVPATSKYPACPAKEYPTHDCPAQCTESGYSVGYFDDKLKASSSYRVQGDVPQIQTELMEHGPLFVSFDVYSDFATYKSGVYKRTSDEWLGGHAVTLIGWGSESGEDYWLVKNSWNEQWGDAGTFKIARGTNECGIEDDINGGTIEGRQLSV